MKAINTNNKYAKINPSSGTLTLILIRSEDSLWRVFYGSLELYEKQIQKSATPLYIDEFFCILQLQDTILQLQDFYDFIHTKEKAWNFSLPEINNDLIIIKKSNTNISESFLNFHKASKINLKNSFVQLNVCLDPHQHLIDWYQKHHLDPTYRDIYQLIKEKIGCDFHTFNGLPWTYRAYISTGNEFIGDVRIKGNNIRVSINNPEKKPLKLVHDDFSRKALYHETSTSEIIIFQKQGESFELRLIHNRKLKDTYSSQREPFVSLAENKKSELNTTIEEEYQKFLKIIQNSNTEFQHTKKLFEKVRIEKGLFPEDIIQNISEALESALKIISKELSLSHTKSTYKLYTQIVEELNSKKVTYQDMKYKEGIIFTTQFTNAKKHDGITVLQEEAEVMFLASIRGLNDIIRESNNVLKNINSTS